MEEHSYEVFATVEKLLRRGAFDEVDRMLDALDLDALDSTGILSVLTITWHGKAHLTTRDAFLARAEPVLVTRLGAERAERLLKNRR